MRIRRIETLVLLIAGLFLAVGCATNDTGIATKVEAKFAADDVVKASQIDVTASDGVITLTGNVDSELTKERALKLARETEGVIRVVDMLAARMPSGNANAPDSDRTFGESIDDSSITLRVKNRLLNDPQVKGLQIDVDTRDGVVYLTGSVETDAERHKAIQLATETSGVKDVQTNLTLPST